LIDKQKIIINFNKGLSRRQIEKDLHIDRKTTDEIISRIRFFLKENEDKKALNRSKQIKKKIDIYEALISEGYDIGYTTVCVVVMDIKRLKEKHLSGRNIHLVKQLNLT